MSASHLTQLYKNHLSLLTDLYQLTMAYGYWKTGWHKKEAVFHLFYRRPPFDGKYVIACGLQLAIDYLQQLSFKPEEIHYLGSLKGADGESLFDESFLNYLQRIEFQCDIDAIPEGTVVFPNQPLVRVKGPLIQAQLIETTLLTLINFSSLIATKAARVIQAAPGDTVVDFGLRRAQGLDGGLTASRAAYIGGCHGTSNLLAGKLYNIPVKGTHAHSWVMCFEDELKAFETYAEVMPGNCVLLVDTYDTIKGIKNAIKVGHQLKEKGLALGGIRLDSGDLAQLSIQARKMLDEAGLEKTAIVASNDLDEYKIKALKDRGAKITVWGVGTRLITAYDQPALGGVYKLAALRGTGGAWNYKIKRSEDIGKVTNPGVLQVRRFFAKEKPVGDMIYNQENTPVSSNLISEKKTKVVNFEGNTFKDLMVPIFRAGTLVYKSRDIHDIRNRCLKQQDLFKAVEGSYPNGLEEGLYRLKMEMIKPHQS